MAIRVLHLIGSLRLGGAQVVLKQIVEHNDDSNIEHFVYPLRCKHVDIPIQGHILSNPYRNYDPCKFVDILRICQQHKIDIIHAHLHKPILGALLATYFTDIPVIVHEHGPIARRGLQYSAYRLMLRLLKNRARAFIAVSKAVAGQLTRYGGVEPGKIKVVYNAVDLERFVPNAEKRISIRAELGIGPETTVVGFVGRLAAVKGPDILQEAFARLLSQKPNCVLLFLGDGPMRDRLGTQASALGIDSKVKFLGFHENVSDYINAFDVAAVTSRQDAFGLAAIELMSMKIPLVSCDVYGLAEIVAHKHNALVLKENTPAQICEHLNTLIGDPLLRQTLVENAAETARDFSIPRLVLHINEIYREIADNH